MKGTDTQTKQKDLRLFTLRDESLNFRGTTLVDRSLCPLSLSVPKGDEYGLIGNGEETRSNLRSGWTFSLTARGPVDQRLHTALHRPAAL